VAALPAPCPHPFEEIEHMTKQIQDAYIVAATRTPVGKAPKGMFRNTRPDDMLAHVLRSVSPRPRASTSTASTMRSSAAPCPKPSRA
jgi:Acetyl-CoA acetyltransferase